jgi:uncharacterized linocin/CFP29 family protein
MSDNVQISTIEDSIAFLNAANARPVVEDMQRNALLRRYEWEEIDAAVIRVAKTGLNAVQDLLDRGLRHNLGGLGTLSSVQEQMSDITEANVDMAAETAGEEDLPKYSPLVWPVPVIHKDFRINIRTLEASRRLGDGLDVSGVELATRRVLEVAEEMLMLGSHMPKVGTSQGQGYANKTGRISDTATNFGGGDFGVWGNGYKTIAGMINALAAKGFAGPFGVYVSRIQYGQLVTSINQYGGSELNSIREGIPGIAFIKPSDDLSDGNVIVVSLQSDVVDFAIAQDLTVVQWQELGGMIQRYKVMLVGTPRVKGDAAGNVGVAHATGA